MTSPPAAAAGVLRAGRVEIDLARGELRRDGVVVPVRRKAWQLLALLCARPGSVITPEEIAVSLWPGTSVSRQGIFTLINEVRDALGGGEEGRSLLATVRGRGYRLTIDAPTAADADADAVAPMVLPAAHPCFVGRERELRALEREWQRAAAGEPRAVFLAGEPGIGKTTLVNEAIARCAERDDGVLRLARGHGFPHRGVTEPYGPIIDALEYWTRADERSRALAFRVAPMWAEVLLASRPAASGPLAVLGSRPGQMLRQAADLLEALAHDRLHVLVLEDAHWADAYTLDLLSLVLRRVSGARLLVLVTYRDREALQRATPVDRVALELRDHASHLDVGPLTVADAARLVRHRLGDHDDGAIRRIYERAGGNPLFLEAFADHPLQPDADDAPGPATLPKIFTRVVEAQWENVSPAAREAIEVGAVLGTRFDTATVAATLHRPLAHVERLLAQPSDRPSFVLPAGTATSADGTVCGTYRFRHETFRRVIYDSLMPARAAQLHGDAGKALAAADKNARRAGEIAEHLILGGRHGLAIAQLERTAAACVAESAVPEAAIALEKALECLRQLPAGRSRDTRELSLVVRLGIACGWLRGPSDPTVVDAYERAVSLLERVDDPDVIGPALRGIWLFRHVLFDYGGMLAIADRMTALSKTRPTSLLFRQAACLRGRTLAILGRQTEALECLEAACAIDSRTRGSIDAWGLDLDAELTVYAAWSATVAGRYALAARRLAEAQRHAARSEHVGTQLQVMWFECGIAQFMGRRDEVARKVEEFSLLAERENQAAWNVIAATLRAGLELHHGNLEAMRGLMASGGGSGEPTLLLGRVYLLGQLAAAAARAGNHGEGLMLVDAALAAAERDGGFFAEPYFWRVKGEIHESLGETAHAEQALATSIEVAQRQGAGLFEQHATLALARLHLHQSRDGRALELVSRARDRFGAAVTLEQVAATVPLGPPIPPADPAA